MALMGTSGQKSFEYLLIPRHYGDFTIPAITYSYFNTSKGRYEKLTTEEVFIFMPVKEVNRILGSLFMVVYQKKMSNIWVKISGSSKPAQESLQKPANIILSKRSFYSAYAFALFVFLVILFLRREHIRRNSDLSIVRNRKAGKVAVKRLRTASACLKNEQIDKFHEEILKAIWGYLSDKLNIPVSDLTRNNAIISLQERGIDENRINNLTGILDACEYARFAPSASGTEAATIYEGASQFIKSVENSIG